ncbi:hypothetical protein FCV25MIE_14718, partial [Fagus crenata]
MMSTAHITSNGEARAALQADVISFLQGSGPRSPTRLTHPPESLTEPAPKSMISSPSCT